MTILKKQLSKWSVFKVLSEQESELILPWIFEKKYKKNESILKQGSYDEHLYFIHEGVVSVNVYLPGGAMKKATELHQGDTFGEVSFLAESPITATLIAETETHCIMIHKNLLTILKMTYPDTAYKTEKSIVHNALQKIIPSCEKMFNFLDQLNKKSLKNLSFKNDKNLLEKISPEKISFEFIKNMPYLQNTSKDDILTLLKHIEVLPLEKNQFLPIPHNNEGLYLIYSGAIMLFLGKENNFFQMLSVSGIGDLLPESWPEKSHLSLMACENSIILKLSKHHAAILREKAPHLFYKIHHHFHREIVNMLYILNRQFARIHVEHEHLISNKG